MKLLNDFDWAEMTAADIRLGYSWQTIVELANDERTARKALLALLAEAAEHIDEWNFPVDLKGRVERALKEYSDAD